MSIHRLECNRWYLKMIGFLIASLLFSNCSSYQSDPEGTITAPIHQSQVVDGQMPSSSLSRGAPQLGVVVDENLVVLEVETHSIAEAAGLQKGDKLETLEGVSFVEERAKVKEMIHRLAEKDTALTLVLQREGKQIAVAIRLMVPQPVQNVSETPPPTITPVLAPEDYF